MIVAFDPEGYLDLSSPEVTYFDPMREKRVDGLAGLRAIIEPMKQAMKEARGSVTEPRHCATK